MRQCFTVEETNNTRGVGVISFITTLIHLCVVNHTNITCVWVITPPHPPPLTPNDGETLVQNNNDFM
jgi:hypothetical protein